CRAGGCAELHAVRAALASDSLRPPSSNATESAGMKPFRDSLPRRGLGGPAPQAPLPARTFKTTLERPSCGRGWREDTRGRGDGDNFLQKNIRRSLAPPLPLRERVVGTADRVRGTRFAPPHPSLLRNDTFSHKG